MTNRSNGADKGDRIVKVLRVYADGKVRAARTPPAGWGTRGRAHAIPNEDRPTAPTVEAPAKVKNPAKVAAGKARAAKAAAAKLAAAQVQAAAVLPKAKPKADKAPAKAPRKAKATPAKKAKAKPATKAAHGGKRAGAGPKPKSEGGPMEVKAFRLTPAQIKKLDKLGGVQFIRDRIDRAA